MKILGTLLCAMACAMAMIGCRSRHNNPNEGRWNDPAAPAGHLIRKPDTIAGPVSPAIDIRVAEAEARVVAAQRTADDAQRKAEQAQKVAEATRRDLEVVKTRDSAKAAAAAKRKANVEIDERIATRSHDQRNAVVMDKLSSLVPKSKVSVSLGKELGGAQWDRYTIEYGEYVLNFMVRSDGTEAFWTRYKAPQPGTEDEKIVADMEAAKPFTTEELAAHDFHMQVPVMKMTPTVTLEFAVQSAVDDVTRAADTKK